jgi:hypothetical protein
MALGIVQGAFLKCQLRCFEHPRSEFRIVRDATVKLPSPMDA